AEKLKAAVAKFVVGDGTAAGTTIGPLINAAAVDKVERLVNESLAAGAQATLGGARHERGGNFYQPTVLINVDNDMPIAQQESFGPVAPLIRVRDADHAVALANATRAGLAAYLYGSDLKQLWSVAERLEFGMVGINEGIISNEMAPFGGMKESGLGREGSKYGIDEYLETQYLCLGGMSDR
ncbi:MAG: aldehyde dehydrogenase family protein, partial [Paraperlucidibaca sp.]